MKKHYLLFPFLAFCAALSAQALAPTLITPAGGYTETNDGSLSWSVGEVAVQEVEQGQGRLSEGFQQIETDTNALALPDDPKTIKALLPNLITPHEDGFHDFFDPVGVLRERRLQVTENEADLTIINRWGEVVFLATQPYRPWDGKSAQGVLMPQATYYYVLILHKSRDIVIRGSVHLLR